MVHPVYIGHGWLCIVNSGKLEIGLYKIQLFRLSTMSEHSKIHSDECRLELENKLTPLHSMILSSDYSIYCFSETWLSNTIYNKEIFPSGFYVYRNDRNKRGGGVLIAVKDTLSCQLLSSPNSLEVVTIRILLKKPVIILSTKCKQWLPTES